MNRLPVVLALAGALFATACDDQLVSPRPGQRPSAVIYDGAHGGANADVFFLPPLVPNPSSFFDAAFNPNVTTAFIQICPIAVLGGECTGDPVATFGNVSGATGPIIISGQEGHYLALWQTADAGLADGLYQIQVFYEPPEAGDEPVAWADVQVVSSGRELKNVADQTIGLLDGRTLPIRIRFEGECTTANCISQTVTNDGADLVLTSGDGALVLQEGWLPAGISEIRVTLQRHDVGPDGDCVGNAAFTGPGLIVQREACLEVTTDPVLVPGPETGIQRPAFIYVCTPSTESDPYHDFLQIFKADDGRPLQALADVSHARLIALGFQPNCEPPIEIGFGSHPLMRLASRGLRAITQPVARIFEVKPLYAIDLGQGGEIPAFDGFSFFTLGVQGSTAVSGETPGSALIGTVVALSVEVASTHTEPEGAAGLSGIDVTFTITDTEVGGGLLSDPEGGAGTSSLTVATGESGVATVYLLVGTGTNTVRAVATVDGTPVTGAVTFSVVGISGPD